MSKLDSGLAGGRENQKWSQNSAVRHWGLLREARGQPFPQTRALPTVLGAQQVRGKPAQLVTFSLAIRHLATHPPVCLLSPICLSAPPAFCRLPTHLPSVCLSVHVEPIFSEDPLYVFWCESKFMKPQIWDKLPLNSTEVLG